MRLEIYRNMLLSVVEGVAWQGREIEIVMRRLSGYVLGQLAL